MSSSSSSTPSQTFHSIAIYTDPGDILAPIAELCSTPSAKYWDIKDNNPSASRSRTRIGKKDSTKSSVSSSTTSENISTIPTKVDNSHINEILRIYTKEYLFGNVVTILPADIVSYAPRVTMHKEYSTYIMNCWDYSFNSTVPYESLSSSDIIIENNLLFQSSDNQQYLHDIQEEHNKIHQYSSVSSSSLSLSSIPADTTSIDLDIYRLTPVFFEQPVPPPPKNIPINKPTGWCRAWVPIEMTHYSSLTKLFGKYYRIYEFNGAPYVSVIVCITIIPKSTTDNDTSNSSSSTSSNSSSSLNNIDSHFHCLFDKLNPTYNLQTFPYNINIDFTFEWYYANDEYLYLPTINKLPNSIIQELINNKQLLSSAISNSSFAPMSHERTWNGYTFNKWEQIITGNYDIVYNYIVVERIRTLCLGYGNDYLADSIVYDIMDIKPETPELFSALNHPHIHGEIAKAIVDILDVFAINLWNRLIRKSLFYAILQPADDEVLMKCKFDYLYVFEEEFLDIFKGSTISIENKTLLFMDLVQLIDEIIQLLHESFTRNQIPIISYGLIISILFILVGDIPIERSDIMQITTPTIDELNVPPNHHSINRKTYPLILKKILVNRNKFTSSIDKIRTSLDAIEQNIYKLFEDGWIDFVETENSELSLGLQQIEGITFPRNIFPSLITLLTCFIPASTSILKFFNADIYNKIVDKWNNPQLCNNDTSICKRKPCNIITVNLGPSQVLKNTLFLTENFGYYVDGNVPVSNILGLEHMLNEYNLSSFISQLPTSLNTNINISKFPPLPPSHIFLRDELPLFYSDINICVSIANYHLSQASVSIVPFVRPISNFIDFLNVRLLCYRCNFAKRNNCTRCPTTGYCFHCSPKIGFPICDCRYYDSSISFGDAFRNTNYADMLLRFIYFHKLVKIFGTGTVHVLPLLNDASLSIPTIHLDSFNFSSDKLDISDILIWGKDDFKAHMADTSIIIPASSCLEYNLISSRQNTANITKLNTTRDYCYIPILFDNPALPIFPYPIVTQPSRIICRFPVWIPFTTVDAGDPLMSNNTLLRIINGSLYVSMWLDICCPFDDNILDSIFNFLQSTTIPPFKLHISYRTVYNDPIWSLRYQQFLVPVNTFIHQYLYQTIHSHPSFGIPYILFNQYKYIIDLQMNKSTSTSIDTNSSYSTCKGIGILIPDNNLLKCFIRFLLMGVASETMSDNLVCYCTTDMQSWNPKYLGMYFTKLKPLEVAVNMNNFFYKAKRMDIELNAIEAENKAYNVRFHRLFDEFITKRLNGKTLGNENECYVRALSLVSLYLLQQNIALPGLRPKTEIPDNLQPILAVNDPINNSIIHNVRPLRQLLINDYNILNKYILNFTNDLHNRKKYHQSEKYPELAEKFNILEKMDIVNIVTLMIKYPLSINILRILIPDVHLILALRGLHKGFADQMLGYNTNIPDASQVSINDVLQQYMNGYQQIHTIINNIDPEPYNFSKELDHGVCDEIIHNEETNQVSSDQSISNAVNTNTKAIDSISNVLQPMKVEETIALEDITPVPITNSTIVIPETSTVSQTISTVIPNDVVIETNKSKTESSTSNITSSNPIPIVNTTTIDAKEVTTTTSTNNTNTINVRVDPEILKEKERIKALKRQQYEEKQQQHHQKVKHQQSSNISSTDTSTKIGPDEQARIRRERYLETHAKLFPKETAQRERIERRKLKVTRDKDTTRIKQPKTTIFTTNKGIPINSSPYRQPTLHEIWKSERTAMWNTKLLHGNKENLPSFSTTTASTSIHIHQSITTPATTDAKSKASVSSNTISLVTSGTNGQKPKITTSNDSTSSKLSSKSPLLSTSSPVLPPSTTITKPNVTPSVTTSPNQVPSTKKSSTPPSSIKQPLSPSLRNSIVPTAVSNTTSDNTAATQLIINKKDTSTIVSSSSSINTASTTITSNIPFPLVLSPSTISQSVTNTTTVIKEEVLLPSEEQVNQALGTTLFMNSTKHDKVVPISLSTSSETNASITINNTTSMLSTTAKPYYSKFSSNDSSSTTSSSQLSYLKQLEEENKLLTAERDEAILRYAKLLDQITELSTMINQFQQQ